MATQWHGTRPDRAGGFTLIEIMITIALIGILASVAGVNYMNYVEKARVARSISELSSISLALESFKDEQGNLPDDLTGVADGIVDPWGRPYHYLKIQGNLPKGIAANSGAGLPAVSSGGNGNGNGGGDNGNGNGNGGGNVMGEVRKDRFLVPINTDFDLYSVGKDGQSKNQLQNKVSRDDVIRASNGSYYGLASNF